MTAADDLQATIVDRAEGFGDVALYNIVIDNGELWNSDLVISEVTDDNGVFVGDYGVSKDAPATLHENISEFIQTVNPEVGACYHNALRFWEEVESAEYVEGHALNQTGAFHHAWNIVDGYIVDTTLAAKAYYGVRIDDETVTRCASIGHADGIWGVFTNWADDHQYFEDNGYL